MRITNREIIIGVSGFVVALVLLGAGLWWHNKSDQKQAMSRQTTADIQEQSSDTASGLSVSGQASSLGQLNNTGEGQAQSQNNNSSGGSGGINPATFSQYDKYKNNKGALFGDIQTGSGSQLKTGQKASIYYKAWLTNGSLVDQSSVSSSGQPQAYSFTLGAHNVIPGLQEGVYGMKVGGKRLVVVPPAVGYGSKGQGAVPPGAVMVFEVQLIKVQ